MYGKNSEYLLLLFKHFSVIAAGSDLGALYTNRTSTLSSIGSWLPKPGRKRIK